MSNARPISDFPLQRRHDSAGPCPFNIRLETTSSSLSILESSEKRVTPSTKSSGLIKSKGLFKMEDRLNFVMVFSRCRCIAVVG